MSEKVTLPEAINNATARAMRNLYTWAPAKVVKLYSSPTGQKVDCQILVKNIVDDEEGDETAESWPVVPGVPVSFMGAGGFRLTCPIKDGTGGNDSTTGMLFFSHLSLDKWLTGSGDEVDPEHKHDHALGDAAFVPGLMPFGAGWSDVPSDGISLGKDGDLQVKIDTLIIMAQTPANAQFVAQANKVKAWLDAFVTAVNGWVVAPNDGGAALKTALSAILGGTPSRDVAASKVKAE